MKLVATCLLSAVLCLVQTLGYAEPVSINGAGSTFIYPVLADWSKTYFAQTHLQINYQGIGSSAGVNQLAQKTLDFSASDEPQTMDRLKQQHWLQFPTVLSGIVPIVHIAGIKNDELVLDGTVLADIYLGKITFWDDPALVQLNPSLALPHNKIITVHRADGSGTTFNFTHYLSQVSATWQTQVGNNTLVKWPIPYSLGAKGNGGVASQIKLIANTIGYVEYAFAQQEQLTMVRMKNKAGRVVSANLDSFNSAAAHAQWNKRKGYYLLLSNQPGEKTWPIIATGFVLVAQDNAHYADIIKFFTTGMQKYVAAATALGYVVIPEQIIEEIRQAMQTPKAEIAFV